MLAKKERGRGKVLCRGKGLFDGGDGGVSGVEKASSSLGALYEKEGLEERGSVASEKGPSGCASYY